MKGLQFAVRVLLTPLVVALSLVVGISMGVIFTPVALVLFAKGDTTQVRWILETLGEFFLAGPGSLWEYE